jgi:hypothetical protein
MEVIKSNCPGCGGSIEFDADSESVICRNCGGAYRVRRHERSISLSPATGPVEQETPLELVEQRLDEIDQLIAEGDEELEAVSSRLQATPLRLGCSFFGLFFAVILVIIGFMLAGRDYVGNWFFYVVIAAVLAAGILRLRAVWPSGPQREELKERSSRISAALSALQLERGRLVDLRARVSTDTPPPTNPPSEAPNSDINLQN